MILLQLLNTFFHITHVLIISFLLISWAFRSTRSIHLVFVILTAFSWIGLGFFFGWGYCFWTDWHWQIRERLEKSHPASYIKLFADSLTGNNWDAGLIDLVTAYVFLLVVALTVFVNLRQFRRAS